MENKTSTDKFVEMFNAASKHTANLNAYGINATEYFPGHVSFMNAISAKFGTFGWKDLGAYQLQAIGMILSGAEMLVGDVYLLPRQICWSIYSLFAKDEPKGAAPTEPTAETTATAEPTPNQVDELAKVLAALKLAIQQNQVKA